MLYAGEIIADYVSGLLFSGFSVLGQMTSYCLFFGRLCLLCLSARHEFELTNYL
jgi:hypothetical protein